MESTLVFAQTVRLRGRAVEWRPRPACEANRGPSPPGKPGAMDRARRDGRTPGVRGSRSVTEGCSAAFEGGELAIRPKGCEPFASGQSARRCISTWPVKGSCCTVTCSEAYKTVGWSEQTRSDRAGMARCPRRARSGKLGRAFVTANAGGPYASQEERGLEAGAEAISRMCPYAECLICRSRQAVLALRSPSPNT